MRHKTFFASIVRFPDRHGPIPPGSFRGRSTRFAAAMARVRRPVPFRTRKLRPCTAMVLHPRGCGRVARRRSTRYGSPRSSPSWAPGGFLVFPPATHARAGRPDDAAPHPPGTPGLISLYLFIHPFLLSRSRPPFYSFVPPLVSSPLSPSFPVPRSSLSRPLPPSSALVPPPPCYPSCAFASFLLLPHLLVSLSPSQVIPVLRPFVSSAVLRQSLDFGILYETLKTVLSYWLELSEHFHALWSLIRSMIRLV